MMRSAVVCREHEGLSRYSDYLDDAAIICSLRCDCTPECLVYEVRVFFLLVVPLVPFL